MIPVKHKTPLKSRTLSPSLNILSPNNDDFERAQVRAARAASHRRKSIGLVGRGDKDYDCEEDILGKGQILDLLQNCIKLAAENVSALSLISLSLSPASIYLFFISILFIVSAQFSHSFSFSSPFLFFFSLSCSLS